MQQSSYIVLWFRFTRSDPTHLNHYSFFCNVLFDTTSPLSKLLWRWYKSWVCPWSTFSSPKRRLFPATQNVLPCLITCASYRRERKLRRGPRKESVLNSSLPSPELLGRWYITGHSADLEPCNPPICSWESDNSHGEFWGANLAPIWLWQRESKEKSESEARK